MEQQTYYLRLYDTSFPVSKEQYQGYYKEQNRWDYLQRLDWKYGLTYYHALDTEEYTGEEILRDGAASVEDMVEKKLLLAQLTKCIEKLAPEERMLVEELFFRGKTERDLGITLGIHSTTIHYKKEKVLLKLKKLLIRRIEETKVA